MTDNIIILLLLLTTEFQCQNELIYVVYAARSLSGYVAHNT